MALPNFKVQTQENVKTLESIPPESEQHVKREYADVLNEMAEIFTRAKKGGDQRAINTVSFISREISTGKLSGDQLAKIDDLQKVFKQVEELGTKYTADTILAEVLGAVYIANQAIQNPEIGIRNKVEIATFALMLASSSISTKELDLRTLKIDTSQGYMPGIALASVSGLLSYLLTSRNSDNEAISGVAESIEIGMNTTTVFLEKQERSKAAQVSSEIAKGIRGEMVASETLTNLAETVQIGLDAFNGNLSEDVYEILFRVSKIIPDIKKNYSAEELTFYERATNVSFLEIFENRGWMVLVEKIKELRNSHYPFFELAKRLSTLKDVNKLDIVRTSAKNDYLGFSDFEIVGFKQGKQENTQHATFRLPVDVKTLSGEEFTKSLEQSEDKIIADLLHSETIALTGIPDVDAMTLSSLEKPPSNAAIKLLSESKQPILLIRVKADAVAAETKETPIESHDANGKRVFSTLQKVVNLQAIPHINTADLATLAYAVASSAELRG